MLQDIVQAMASYLIGLFSTSPILAVLISVVGMFRLIMKPLMSLVRAGLEAVKGKQEGDKEADAIEQSKSYQIVAYILDWLASIKLQTK